MRWRDSSGAPHGHSQPAFRSQANLVHPFRQSDRPRRGTSRHLLRALAIIVIWAVTGPLFGFSDTWQLVINTGTTIVTFLMVFLIQNTQNRDTEAIQVKLDELIRSIDGAHLRCSTWRSSKRKILQRISKGYRELAQRARKELDEGKSGYRCARSRRHASQGVQRAAAPLT